MKHDLNVSTKLSKDDKNPKRTALILDYTGVTVDEIIPVAEDGLVIKLQGRWRRAGSVPATATVSVKQFIASIGTRAAAAPVTLDRVAASFNSLSPEEQAQLMARYQQTKVSKKAA